MTPTAAEALEALGKICSELGGRIEPQESFEARDALVKLFDTLRAFIEGAGADSERYRWLRDIGDATWASMASRVPEGAAGIDAAIDAARAAMLARSTPSQQKEPTE